MQALLNYIVVAFYAGERGERGNSYNIGFNDKIYCGNYLQASRNRDCKLKIPEIFNETELNTPEARKAVTLYVAWHIGVATRGGIQRDQLSFWRSFGT